MWLIHLILKKTERPSIAFPRSDAADPSMSSLACNNIINSERVTGQYLSIYKEAKFQAVDIRCFLNQMDKRMQLDLGLASILISAANSTGEALQTRQEKKEGNAANFSPGHRHSSNFKSVDLFSINLCILKGETPQEPKKKFKGNMHLTGEDNQCPATNCQTRLSMSSVFPKATLDSSLSDQSCDLLLGHSGLEVEDPESCSQTKPYNSSKTKAALEVLQSLFKPQCRTSQENCVMSTSKESTDCRSTSADSGKSSSDVLKKKTMLIERH
ncbi:hypothetical protein KIW84_033430 [Lathyrus oleraceus]|uniref:Uncharacterized protein n=1 Tax=Pisum sativum TaxID=3888 RepID=A0A9D4Y051_PEA|nr:hypothetical protein KIW84_033430 [Pisum sativum]